jgi:catechol 2,3-dioxygenase-like lactoylglutathione lyase family enzyme
MSRASISHIALTVRDLNRSTEFYDKIFKFMGYMPVEVPEPGLQPYGVLR